MGKSVAGIHFPYIEDCWSIFYQASVWSYIRIAIVAAAALNVYCVEGTVCEHPLWHAVAVEVAAATATAAAAALPSWMFPHCFIVLPFECADLYIFNI